MQIGQVLGTRQAQQNGTQDHETDQLHHTPKVPRTAIAASVGTKQLRPGRGPWNERLTSKKNLRNLITPTRSPQTKEGTPRRPKSTHLSEPRWVLQSSAFLVEHTKVLSIFDHSMNAEPHVWFMTHPTAFEYRLLHVQGAEEARLSPLQQNLQQPGLL